MTALERISAVLIAARAAPTPDQADGLARHVVDTLGALIAGRAVEETKALARALADHDGAAAPSLASQVICAVACARATEIDDIHLGACVTPSAVAVPVALLTARHLGIGDGAGLLGAVRAGHEAMVRLGRAAEGTKLLGRGIWPTQIAAGFAAAATAAALMDLNAVQTAHGLGLALAGAGGVNARGGAPTGRFAPIGFAAANGLLSAFGAARGMTADLGLLDGRWAQATGIEIIRAVLEAPPSDRWAVDEVSFKPWCGARQAMAATAAFGDILAASGFDPETLRDVAVEVPAPHRGMLDRAKFATDRQDSFADLRYSLGLAAFLPDALFDVTREPLPFHPAMPALAAKVRIVAGPDLLASYPARWPARVTVTAADGGTHAREIFDTPGDPGAAMGWDGLIDKFARVTGRGAGAAEAAVAACRTIAETGGLARVLALAESR